jgi:hypothetical protein
MYHKDKAYGEDGIFPFNLPIEDFSQTNREMAFPLQFCQLKTFPNEWIIIGIFPTISTNESFSNQMDNNWHFPYNFAN